MTIRLSLPADASYASVLRTTAAAIAARCDLTYERVEDARLAIDEAFSQVLSFALPDATVDCAFEESPADLRFEIAGPTSLESQLPTDTFAWTVLSALADELRAEVAGGRLAIHVLVHQSQEVSV